MRTYITTTNFDNLINPTQPEHFYTLGFIWADGYILNNYKKRRISIEIQKEDGDVLHDIFLSCGTWHIQKRSRTNRKPQINFATHNKYLFKHLLNFDYDKKSFASPDKIFNLIPLEYQHYWFYGYFDGDGCFYHNNKSCFQTSICSSYTQDWSLIENLYQKLDIKYKVERRISSEKSKFSVIRTSGKDSYFKIGQYMYQNKLVGLPRKFEKWKLVLDKIK